MARRGTRQGLGGQGAGRALTVLGLLLLALTGPAGAAPTKRPPKPRAAADPRRVDELVRRGQAALQARDFAAAAAALDEAFRILPQPTTLYLLGELAAAEQHVVEAQDRMRRFLADPTRNPADTARVQEAERVLRLPRPSSSEVRLFGEAGSLVRVDGRPVGVLPLEAPLLIATGKHPLSAERGDARASLELEVPPGRVLDVRFDQLTGTAAVTPLPAVVLVLAAPGLSVAEGELLRSRLGRLLLQRDLAPLDPALVPATSGPVSPLSAACVESVACLGEQARARGADLVLRLAIDGRSAVPDSAWTVTLGLVDAHVGLRPGEQAASRTQRCAPCSVDRLSPLLPPLLGEVLSEGRARPRGELEIRSQPPGAEVVIDDQPVGRTPLRRQLWAGPRDYVLRLPDRTEQRGHVQIEPGQHAVVEAMLPPRLVPTALKPAPVELVRGRRPVSRLVLGSIAVAAGVTMAGFGASALAVSGQCVESSSSFPPPAPCPQVFGTVPIGASLLAAGIMVSAAGVGLLAWPAPLQRREPARLADASAAPPPLR
ncbi:MAG: PEGA domain-containing protein [Polyangia bacterium]